MANELVQRKVSTAFVRSVPYVGSRRRVVMFRPIVLPRKGHSDWAKPMRRGYARRRSVIYGGRFYHDMVGLYRVFNPAEFQLFDTSGDPLATTPTESTPVAVTPTLPIEPADVYTVKVNKFSMVRFNGVLSSGLRPLGPKGETFRAVYLAGGVQVLDPPDAPGGWDLKTKAGGVVNVAGWYRQAAGTLRAVEWALYFTFDGSTPSNPLLAAPDAVTPMPSSGAALLDFDLAAQADGTTVKVRVHTRRLDGAAQRYSEASTVLTITADDSGPAALL